MAKGTRGGKRVYIRKDGTYKGMEVTDRLEDEEEQQVKPAEQHQAAKSVRFTDIKNKNDFVNFVEQQTNVRLENDTADTLNKKKNILYTKIEKKDRMNVRSLLNKNNVRHEEHMGGYYWIYLNGGK